MKLKFKILFDIEIRDLKDFGAASLEEAVNLTREQINDFELDAVSLLEMANKCWSIEVEGEK
jgi:hypothetical protein